MRLIYYIALNALSIWLYTQIAGGGVTLNDGIFTALVAGLVLGLVNFFVRPLVKLLALPLTVLTLGLFIIVINALMLQLTAWLMPDLYIAGFMQALYLALFMALLNLVYGMLGLRKRS